MVVVWRQTWPNRPKYWQFRYCKNIRFYVTIGSNNMQFIVIQMNIIETWLLEVSMRGRLSSSDRAVGVCRTTKELTYTSDNLWNRNKRFWYTIYNEIAIGTPSILYIYFSLHASLRPEPQKTLYFTVFTVCVVLLMTSDLTLMCKSAPLIYNWIELSLAMLHQWAALLYCKVNT